MAAKQKEILLLIDSHALIHRAYHAFPDTLVTKDGTVVNAVYGFARLLLDVLAKFQPDYVVAAMDASGPTFRHKQYGAYKANRKPTDDALKQQIPLVDALLEKFDIPMLRVEGFEADDIIGTLDARHSGRGKQTVIVTGDRDLFQLVDEDTQVYLAGSSFSKSQLYDVEAVTEKMGVKPEQVVEIKALQGDSSDNIPGVAGVGEKTAIKLLSKYADIDDLYANIQEIEPRWQKKLSENVDLAYISRELAKIDTAAPVHFDFKDAPFGTFDATELANFFQEYEFKSLQNTLQQLVKQQAPSAEEGYPASLFGEVMEAETCVAWDGEELADENLVIDFEVDKTSNPLRWRLQKAYFLQDDTVVEVSSSQFEKFFTSLRCEWLIGFDMKALLHCLDNLSIKPRFRMYDLGISSYLLTQGIAGKTSESILQHYAYAATLRKDKLQAYREISKQQKGDLQNRKKLQKLIKLETDLLPVVAAMERSGVGLDQNFLQQLQQELEAKIETITRQIYDDVGHEFNIASPKQVGEVLFEEKGLPAKKKTKTGAYSTDERILKELRELDPVVEKILSYRELTKLLSTYVKPLPEHVDAETGKIHAEFLQLGAITGRFSSQNPNLQNIPVREGEGAKLRNAFVAEEGKYLIALDYSQQELRLLAELSQEENMLEAFSTGVDIHTKTAAEIFDLPLAKVTKAERRAGKTINFGIVYGISAFGLADRLKIGQQEAAEFIDRYFERYPKVREYYDQLLQQASDQGYVETILGRRRDTRDLRSNNYHLRAAAEREIMNFPLQGGAADMTKLAMLRAFGTLQDLELEAELILQIHDEIIFQVVSEKPVSEMHSDKKLLDFVRKVRHNMLEVVELTVPLEVEVEIGKAWGSLQTLDI